MYHMSLDAQSLAFTKMLATASTQHLRLTLEPLPVGLIEITERGIIESVDEATALMLGLTPKQLQGKSIAMVLEERDFAIFELLESRQYGTLFKTTFRTRNGAHVLADVVLEPALQSHKFVCSVIFTTADVLAGEPEPLVFAADDHLEASPLHSTAAHEQNSLGCISAVLLALVISLFCFFVLLFVSIK
jgi:PAS domain S-box-containing protein